MEPYYGLRVLLWWNFKSIFHFVLRAPCVKTPPDQQQQKQHNFHNLLTDSGDQRVGEEHGGCQVPVGGQRRISEDGDAVLVGRDHTGEELFERRRVDAALVQKLLLQRFDVLAHFLLHRPLDAGENQSPEQQIDDIEEYEACEQQPRLANRMHVSC